MGGYHAAGSVEVLSRIEEGQVRDNRRRRESGIDRSVWYQSDTVSIVAERD